MTTSCKLRSCRRRRLRISGRAGGLSCYSCHLRSYCVSQEERTTGLFCEQSWCVALSSSATLLRLVWTSNRFGIRVVASPLTLCPVCCASIALLHGCTRADAPAHVVPDWIQAITSAGVDLRADTGKSACKRARLRLSMFSCGVPCHHSSARTRARPDSMPV